MYQLQKDEHLRLLSLLIWLGAKQGCHEKLDWDSSGRGIASVQQLTRLLLCQKTLNYQLPYTLSESFYRLHFSIF